MEPMEFQSQMPVYVTVREGLSRTFCVPSSALRFYVEQGLTQIPTSYFQFLVFSQIKNCRRSLVVGGV